MFMAEAYVVSESYSTCKILLQVAFFTSRAVKPMEELTWDYRIDFDDDTHHIEAFKCLCGSPFCRGASSSKKRKKRGRK
ncbi:hypothetical protein R1sor_012624 [Riccia sorocarpa]|uniref:Post-SET domain-containing protein n=1 Tax=Riccia sorocarpa TaxID=122646 RepID=A0ABD3I4B8_9MARC